MAGGTHSRGGARQGSDAALAGAEGPGQDGDAGAGRQVSAHLFE